MSQRNKFWFVLLSVLTIAAVLILASGISTLEIGLDREPLPRLRPEEGMSREEPSDAPSDIIGTVMQVILVVSAALLPFAIILYIISPQARRRVFENLLAVLAILLPLYLLQRMRAQVSETGDDILSPEGPAQMLPPASDIAPAPNPSNSLVVVVTVGLALLLSALLIGLVLAFWRRRRPPASSLDRLAEEAQEAADAIQAGADLRDTVTRCYFEMMRVLKEERGVRRERAMTPREFEARLEGIGVPTTQVRRLTRLFEQVRYGDKPMGQQEERQAVISLTSIARFCRRAS
jgi:uncharacterized membrane protein YhaH (DUF805 family)